MSVKVVLVNGYPGAGKTSFEEMCQFILGPYYRCRSTVDKVKEIAKQCGWDGTKDLPGRRFLSDLKDAFTRYNDMPLKDIISCAENFAFELEQYGVDSEHGVLFVDVREPFEIEKLKEALNGITVFIERDEVKNKEKSNHADSDVEDFIYDYYINNNGSYEDLAVSARHFLQDINAIEKFDET